MGKYYCGMCETSHHDLIEKYQCERCARFFCMKSISEMLDVGKNGCPYCDSPLIDRFEGEKFSSKLPQRGEKGLDYNTENWFTKAQRLKNLEMYEEAFTAINKELDQEPLNAQAWFLKAEILTYLEFSEQNNKRIDDALEKSLKIDPANIEVKAFRINYLLTRMQTLQTCRELLDNACRQAFGLSLALNYPTMNNIDLLVAKAITQAKKIRETISQKDSKIQFEYY